MDDIARFGAYLSDEKHSSRNTVSSFTSGIRPNSLSIYIITAT